MIATVSSVVGRRPTPVRIEGVGLAPEGRGLPTSLNPDGRRMGTPKQPRKEGRKLLAELQKSNLSIRRKKKYYTDEHLANSLQRWLLQGSPREDREMGLLAI